MLLVHILIMSNLLLVIIPGVMAIPLGEISLNGPSMSELSSEIILSEKYTYVIVIHIVQLIRLCCSIVPCLSIPCWLMN